MAELQFGVGSNCGAKSRRPKRPSPRNVVRVAQEYNRFLSRHEVTGYRQVAEHFGVTKARVSHYLSVLQLPQGFLSWLEKCNDPIILNYFTERRLRSMIRSPGLEQVQRLSEAASHLDIADADRAELLNVLRDCAT